MAISHAASARSMVTRPNLRRIGFPDLKAALLKGVEDFMALPTHVLFLIAIYPIAGVIIAAATFESDLLPILFPLASGFALIGPFAAVGLYELSRQRELGLPLAETRPFAPLTGRHAGSIFAVGPIITMFQSGLSAEICATRSRFIRSSMTPKNPRRGRAMPA